jgi:hypothetical protein
MLSLHRSLEQIHRSSLFYDPRDFFRVLRHTPVENSQKEETSRPAVVLDIILCVSSGKCAFPVLCVFVFMSPSGRQEDDHILFKKGNSCRLAHFRGFGADGRRDWSSIPPDRIFIFPSLLSCATPGLAALPFLCGLQQLLISRCGLQSCQ